MTGRQKFGDDWTRRRCSGRCVAAAQCSEVTAQAWRSHSLSAARTMPGMDKRQSEESAPTDRAMRRLIVSLPVGIMLGTLTACVPILVVYIAESIFRRPRRFVPFVFRYSSPGHSHVANIRIPLLVMLKYPASFRAR